jgi:hypothetical protein
MPIYKDTSTPIAVMGTRIAGASLASCSRVSIMLSLTHFGPRQDFVRAVGADDFEGTVFGEHARPY